MKRSGWYILLVKQGFELQIKDQLVKKIKEFCIEEVLTSEEFTGYVFIRSINPPSNYHLELEGTLKFLGTKKCPQRFCNSEINRLSLIPNKKVEFHIGDHVIVKKGDLENIEGQIVKLGKRIVKIKPMFFQKIVKTRVQDIDFL